MKSICVFCGSASGAKPEYAASAKRLGAALAARGIRLVYGGSGVGLMLELANSALETGGHVVGVIPRLLVEREVAHHGLSELRVVDSMHERKATMAALASAFIALPGGVGTFDEIFEMLSWLHLGIHDKPCGFLNVQGYYSKLMEFLDYATAEQFFRPELRARIVVEESVDALLEKLMLQMQDASRGRDSSLPDQPPR